MIKPADTPAGRRVAVIAAVAALDVIRRFTLCRSPVVATRAGALYRAVAEPDRPPGVCNVTTAAVVSARNVIDPFAGGANAVVAIGATAHRQAVIESCRRPKSGRVAIVAGVGGGDVIQRFTKGCSAIVTAGAAPDHRTMFHVPDRCPFIRCVAIIAPSHRRDMVDGLARCAHPCATPMTVVALAWCTLENSAYVAFLTSDAIVGPGEQKTGCEVIKGLVKFGYSCR